MSHEILAYNQTFIQENFFEAENVKGIFTLSKENKDAEIKIENALKEIKKLEVERDKTTQERDTEMASINKKQETAKNPVWKIKTDYSGGDGFLNFV